MTLPVMSVFYWCVLLLKDICLSVFLYRIPRLIVFVDKNREICEKDKEKEEKCLQNLAIHGILYGHSYKEFKIVNKQAKITRLKD